ncbi:DUF1843 domain-containing protein [Paraburkholderia sp. D15]|uniref:DUF1843 domain-containing protein n=1 Tax=Paraburkholderia sp. D15 TaxID=2880218 RepID=UPI00247A19F7|nr:DUF1843 domain-containing protein [Paraburkholderia sp. D15]WGS54240.1 DUF1843 domain-containing protein [Paraburkholderia sp. D15]WKF60216.1 hypothetical protein HUO10_004737 [Paraburkholderia busanensis]
MSQAAQHPITPYGVAIHQAMSTGDLTQMKALLAKAESLLEQQGNLAAAIEVLKLEIARLERQ